MLTLELPKSKSKESMAKMAKLDVSGIPWKSLPRQINILLIPKVWFTDSFTGYLDLNRLCHIAYVAPAILKLQFLGMVLFDDGEDLQVIEVPLISSSKFEEFVEFKVVLIEPQGKCSLGNNQKENISKKLSILPQN